MDGLQRRQHAGGIVQLIGAAQRRKRQAVSLAAPPPILPLVFQCTEAEVLASQQQIGADELRMVDYALGNSSIRKNRRPAGAEDARLFMADGFYGVAQIILVVEIYAGEDGAVGVEHVHRIEPAPEADFEYDHIEVCAAEKPHGGQRAKLEIGQGNIAARRLYRFKGCAQCFIGCRPLADSYPLVVVDQMGRRVAANAIGSRGQDGLQHRASGPLAVGAAHGNDGNVRREPQPVPHRHDAVETQINTFGVQLLLVTQPVVERFRRHEECHWTKKRRTRDR